MFEGQLMIALHLLDTFWTTVKRAIVPDRGLICREGGGLYATCPVLTGCGGLGDMLSLLLQASNTNVYADTRRHC
jgi:hypothetical protein